MCWHNFENYKLLIFYIILRILCKNLHKCRYYTVNIWEPLKDHSFSEFSYQYVLATSKFNVERCMCFSFVSIRTVLTEVVTA